MGSCLPGDGGDGGFDDEIFRMYGTNYRAPSEGSHEISEPQVVEGTKSSLKDRILKTLKDLFTQE